MARRIQAQEVEAARIHVITNWCDDETIKPIAQANNSPRETWQLAGKFVVGYSGNLIAAGLASRQAKLRLWLQSCDNGHRNRRPLQKWASIRGEWKFTRRGSLARWSQLLDQVIAS